MITINRVSKKFKLYRRPMDRMVEIFGMGERHDSFWALRHISLEIPRGRALGIVGQNGAGKSTLLKLITGTLMPTEGTINVDGRVAALLELGTGFHPEFTGRQNIRVNGQLLGMSPEELAALEEEIISFSELGPFINQPLRTYSSGMVMRLGFSIAAALRPEVLIVDEALSVGDARFSQKCTRRIREIREGGATILFVSHDPSAVSSLCDEAVLLDKGTIRSRGNPREVLEDYNALLAAQGEGNRAMTISWVGERGGDGPGKRRSGTFQALVNRLEVRNQGGAPSEVFQTGDILRLYIQILFLTPVRNPTVGVALRDRLGIDLFGTNTALHGLELGEFKSGQTASLELEMPLRLGYGDYSITVAIHEDETHLESCFDWTDNAATFRVREIGKNKWSGLVHHEAAFTKREDDSENATVSEALLPLFGDLPGELDPAFERTPSPYLKGVRGIGDSPDHGSHRWLHSRAWVVCRPKGKMLYIHGGFECRSPEDLAGMTVRVGIVGHPAVSHVYKGARQYAALALEIPEELRDGPMVLHLETDPPVDADAARQHLGIDDEAGFALYGISASPREGWSVLEGEKRG